MPIHLLPPEVASQIAAGEVVERPASVVKELVENALDANARHIRIAVEGAGQRLIEVSDDGEGIPAGELRVAVERHATSKLSSAADLFHISTLGFRGEALASIGSVARLTLTSRPKEASAGARLVVEGGIAGEVEPVGAPVGTSVRVENLFYNVPARRKFMKGDATERRVIDALVTRYALAYPEVRFHLLQEGKPALQTSGSGDRREVLAALYGIDIARAMIEVLFEDDGLSVKGFTSPTSQTRSNRKEIIFFVNGRPVQDVSLTTALVQAYHTLLMIGRYPLAALFIDLSPDAVDVNVHPTKAEVRFREADKVFRAVQRATRRALLAHTPVPQLGESLRWSQDIEEEQKLEDESRAADFNRWMFGEDAPPEKQLPDEPEMATPLASDPVIQGISAATQAPLPSQRVPLLRLVGQIASTYLVAEGPDGLYLIDQHAAHERVLFEQFMAQLGEDRPRLPAQSLLQPESVDLPPASARLLDDQLPILDHLGFKVEPFGPGAFLVRAVPALLAGMDPTAALRVLIENFEEDETPLGAELEARIVARVCKRAAVKGGQVLSSEEQRALLADLENCRSPRTCPHGRPTMIHLSVDLLERQFGRRGAR